MSGTAARLRQTGSLVETSVPQNLGLWADSLLSSPHSRVRLNLLDQLGPCGRRPIPVPVERKPVAGNGPFRRRYYSVVLQYPIVVQYPIVPSVRACACSKAKYAIGPIRITIRNFQHKRCGKLQSVSIRIHGDFPHLSLRGCS